MKLNVKKVLLAGTALVAVSFVGVSGASAQTIDVSATGNIATATGANGTNGASPTAGAPGARFTVGEITGTATGDLTGGIGGADTDAGAFGLSGGAGFSFNSQNGDADTATTLIINEDITVTGGAGGAGAVAVGGTTTDTAGAGAAGGAGVLADGNFNAVTNNGEIVGGAGGAGGAGTDGADVGGAGGSGSAGLSLAGANASATSAGSITGGNGGAGGDGFGAGAGGLGGSGGAAVTVGGADATLSVSGDVVGGNGGVGGDSTSGTAGNGGSGGSAIIVNGTGASITVNKGAMVVGGIGGAAGTGSVAGTDGADATAIVINAGGTTDLLSNAGTIGDDAVNAIAIDVTTGETVTALTNTGSIVSTDSAALNVAGTITTLTNSGTISSTTGAAVNIAAGGDIGTFTNTSGTITSGGAATFVVGGDLGGLVITGGTISNTRTADDTGIALDINAAQTGAITISGTTAIVSNGKTGSGAGVAVDFAGNAGSLTNNGSITGRILGAANAQTLTNTGTITGNVDLGAGANVINLVSGTVTGTITTGANADTFDIDAGTVSGAVNFGDGDNVISIDGGTLSSTLTAGADDDALTISGGTLAGAVDLGAGNNSVDVDGTFSTSNTFANIGALSVTGTGNLTVGHVLNGVSTLDIASGGALTLNESLGTTGALTNAGTLSIAAGETLTVADQVAAAGKYIIGVTSASSFGSLVNTTTDIDLTGATVEVDVADNTYIADGAALKFADGVGAATGVTNGTDLTDNSRLLDFTLERGDSAAITGGNSSDVYLLVDRTALDDVATTSNNQSVGAMLEDLGTNGDADVDAFQGRLNMASSTEEVDELLDSVTPDVSGGALAGALIVNSATSGLITTRLADLRSGAGAGVATGNLGSGTRVWGQAFGSTADQDNRDSVEGYEADTMGVALGVDAETTLEGTVVGLAVGYANTDVDAKDVNNTETDIDSYQVFLYSETDIDDRTFLNGQLGYIFSNNDVTRSDVGGVSGLTATGDFDTNQYVVRAELGRDFYASRDMILTPSLLFNYNYVDFDSYSETGAGGLSLTDVDTDEVQILELGVNLKAEWALQNNDGSLVKPNLHGGYRYDFIGDEIATTAALAGGGAAFSTEGADPAQGTLNLGAGLTYYCINNWELSANYDFEYKEDYDAHSGFLRAGYKF